MLVVAQLSVSLALVVAGGLFARAAINAAAAEAGYPLDRQIVVGLDPSLSGYNETRTRAAYAAVLERPRALPGVEHASFASTVAFGDVQMNGRVRSSADAPDVDASFDIIGADYFETLGLRVLRGRGFTAGGRTAREPDAWGLHRRAAGDAGVRRRRSDRAVAPIAASGRPIRRAATP